MSTLISVSRESNLTLLEPVDIIDVSLDEDVDLQRNVSRDTPG